MMVAESLYFAAVGVCDLGAWAVTGEGSCEGGTLIESISWLSCFSFSVTIEDIVEWWKRDQSFGTDSEANGGQGPSVKFDAHVYARTSFFYRPSCLASRATSTVVSFSSSKMDVPSWYDFSAENPHLIILMPIQGRIGRFWSKVEYSPRRLQGARLQLRWRCRRDLTWPLSRQRRDDVCYSSLKADIY